MKYKSIMLRADGGEEQLIALLDKIKTNHCKNYHGRLFWRRI